jgi:tRNA (mo5U34)-methyltransferase
VDRVSPSHRAAELYEGVERLRPWFHRIELPEGVATKTESVSGEPADHPAGTWRHIGEVLPHDLSGQTVLDVGCNAGFYSFEAKKRGAARVLGVDAQRHHVRQATWVRDVLGIEVDFRRMSVYDLSVRDPGPFDVVLALGLIYHCKHLVLALERLFQVTGGRMILETAVLPPAALRQWPSRLPGHRETLWPLAYFDNRPEAKEAVYNWFLPSVEAVLTLLKTVGFDRVTPVSAADGRAVVVAEKPQSSGDAVALLRHAAGEIECRSPALSCRPGEEFALGVTVRNTGTVTWRARPGPAGEPGVRLGAHLLTDRGSELHWDFGRADLPRDLAPAAEAPLELRLRAPQAPGRYTIELDLVAEGQFWFEDTGGRVTSVDLSVLTG